MLAMPERQYVVGLSEGLMFYQLCFDGLSVNDKIKVGLIGQSDTYEYLIVPGPVWNVRTRLKI